MKKRQHVAVIGSGASSIYLLKHLLDQVHVLKPHLEAISIFEKSSVTGMGMPYSPETTDRFNMSNISSEELPELPVTFAEWLRAQDPSTLAEWGLENQKISVSEVYNRLALGQYLHAQYETIIAQLRNSDIPVQERPGCEILDVREDPEQSRVAVVTCDGQQQSFDRVIIATGHHWAEEDQPHRGYYASPWPISKLLPAEGERHNFAVGTLGASLSAYDVIASLAHRHGDFVAEGAGRMSFHPHPGTEKFKIVMHAGHGLLPHLQFDQEEPFREIYRHVSREGLLALVDQQGFLRMDTYFDHVCRPALSLAFEKDEMFEMVGLIADPRFGWLDFVEKMTGKHDYANAFEGMRLEMNEARESVLHHKPIHWKEVIDDLVYTLNFHAELMPAEDHLLLHTKVMPFLMNVIAAMPLPSGGTIMALYDAGKLDLVTGKVSLAEKQAADGMTTIIVAQDDEESAMDYRMFVDCSGQKPLELEDYPFPSLVKDGSVRKARAAFVSDAQASAERLGEKKKHLFEEAGAWFYHIGGIDIDGTYRLVGRDGKPNPRIQDIAFPHTSGVRPYSYGLQACSATSAIVVMAWVKELQTSTPVENDVAEITQIYEKVPEGT